MRPTSDTAARDLSPAPSVTTVPSPDRRIALARSFSIYTVSSVLAGAVPLLLLPVLTRYLTEADYGTVATITALITFLTPPLVWGTTSAMTVEYFKRDPEEFSVYFSSVLRIPALGFAALLLTAAVGALLFAERLGISAAWFFASAVFVALSFLPQVLLAILRVRDEAMTYAYFEVVMAVVTVVLSVVFVAVFKLAWQGRMYATAIASILMTALAVAWLARRGYFVAAFDRSAFKSGVRFGSGLVLHDLGNQTIRVADRVFVVALVGLQEGGQYAVATQVAGVLLILLAAFNRVWAPYVFSQLKAADAAVKRALVRRSYLVVGCAFLFIVAFNAAVPLAYALLIDPKFHGSMPYVQWLTLGYFFTAVYMTYIDYIFYTGKTQLLSAITTFNLICNLSLNYLFVRAFGPVGAAYAFAGTMFVVMLLAFVLSSRVYPMPWLYWLRERT